MGYKNEVLFLSDRMRLIKIDKKNIYVQARYGPSKIIKLPLRINENLSCLIALIIGDGHLSKYKFRTSIESSSKELLSTMQKMVESLFDANTPIKKVKERVGRKRTYHLSIYSKAIQELFNLIFGILRGNKSNFVRVPKQILLENKKIKNAFVIGLLAAEGSRKGKNGVRMCSASSGLLLDTQKILKELKIDSQIESWINKKYKKRYYSLSFKRNLLDSLMRRCRSGQTGQILSVFKRMIKDQA